MESSKATNKPCYYTLINKPLNECGYFPSKGFHWKTHIEMTNTWQVPLRW